MGNKNTIEFNGNVYDAITGKLVKSGGQSAAPGTKIKVADTSSKPQSPAKKLSVKDSPNTKSKPRVTKQHQGHRPAKSIALVRSSVKKPAAKDRPSAKAQVASSVPAKHLSNSPIASRLALSERRLARAQQTVKGSGIRHFRSTDNDRAFKRLKPLPLKQPSTANEGLKPVAKIEQSSTINKLDDILAAGLARATSHEQLSPSTSKSTSKRLKVQARRARWLILGLGAIIIILVIGLLLAYFTPGFELTIASSRSGVPISLPKYDPPGFHFDGPGKFVRGGLTLNFSGHQAGQRFQIIAKNSTWDSQTLLYSFVTNTDPNYQTVKKADLTIYVYQKNNITWVNGGVWFQINGPGLSVNQLTDIATSM